MVSVGRVGSVGAPEPEQVQGARRGQWDTQRHGPLRPIQLDEGEDEGDPYQGRAEAPEGVAGRGPEGSWDIPLL